MTAVNPSTDMQWFIVHTYSGFEMKVKDSLWQRAEAMGSLSRGFLIAFVSIFILIAVPLRSYMQAIVIMLTVIQFRYIERKVHY